MVPLASTAARRRTTNRPSRQIGRTSWTAFGRAAITHRRCAGPTSRKRTVRNGRSASRPSKTRWRNALWRWCWRRSTSRNFLPCSYGFRPGRSAHQALDALRAACMGSGVRWCIDVDIKSYFDTIDHGHLRDFLDQRVTDGVIRRMIDKWLKAGVLEEGRLHRPTQGSPQGGVISPCLSNIYLHHVLDEWFEHMVRPRLKGGASLVRYADDRAPRRREEGIM